MAGHIGPQRLQLLASQDVHWLLRASCSALLLVSCGADKTPIPETQPRAGIDIASETEPTKRSDEADLDEESAHLRDLMEAEVVEAEITWGSDGTYAFFTDDFTLRIRRRPGLLHTVRAKLPPGTVLVCDCPRKQEVVVISHLEPVLTTDWWMTKTGRAVLVENKPLPAGGDRLKFAEWSSDELTRAANALFQRPESFTVTQFAMWIVGEDATNFLTFTTADLDYYWFTNRRDGTWEYGGGEEVVRALKILWDAGIDVRTKKIWNWLPLLKLREPLNPLREEWRTSAGQRKALLDWITLIESQAPPKSLAGTHVPAGTAGYAYYSDTKTNQTLLHLPEVEVTVLERQGSFAQVELVSGAKFWVPLSALSQN